MAHARSIGSVALCHVLGWAVCLAAAACGAASPTLVDDPPQYVGGERCRSCHPAQYEQWETSDHRRAMQPASSAVAPVRREGDRYFVPQSTAGGETAEYEVHFTFGVDPLQQFLTPHLRGRYQALNVAWDSRPSAHGGQRWIDLYAGERPAPGDPLHWTGAAQNWNYMCAECHSTNLEKNYAAGDDTYRTAFTDMNVSCEACHGPGSRHVAWAAGGSSAVAPGLTVAFQTPNAGWPLPFGSATAVRAGARPAAGEVDACGFCHSRRAPVARYQPGQPLADSHEVALLDPGLYEPDGQPLDEVYEYGSFLQSRMFAAGVTCATCHDPHTGRRRLEGNALCTQCHRPEVFDVPSHSRHPAGSSAGACVSCHMPARTYMTVDVRRDHSFRVPRPDHSVRFGVSNPCSGCHSERSAQWAADALRGVFDTSAPDFVEAIFDGRRRSAGAGRKLAAVATDAQFPGIVRATAVSLLRTFPSDETSSALAQLSQDRDPLVRRSVAAALPLLPPTRLLEIGARLVTDPIRTVRLQAVLPVAEALGQHGRQKMPGLAAAIAEFRAAQSLNADRPESHLNLGLLEQALGATEAAERAFRTATRLPPPMAGAFVNLAEVLRSRTSEEEVDAILAQGQRTLPQSAELRYARGLSAIRRGDRTGGLDQLREATRLDPGAVDYAYAYAVALHDTGRATEAVRELERAVARVPGDRRVLQALVTYSVRQGRLAEARAWARRLVEAAPADPAALRILQLLTSR